MKSLPIRTVLTLAITGLLHLCITAQSVTPNHTDSLAAKLGLTSDSVRTDLLITLGEELATSNPQQAFAYGTEALALAQDARDAVRTGLAFKVLAKVYNFSAVYDKALEAMLESLRHMESVNDTLQIARSYDYLGEIYMASGDFSNARNYFQKALALNIKLRNFPQIAMNYKNMGGNYMAVDSVEKALSYYTVSLLIADSLKLENDRVALMNNIGIGYSKLGKHEDALKYFYKLLEMIAKESDNYMKASAMVNIGRGYLGMKRFPTALKFARDGYALSKTHGFLQVTRDAAQTLSDIYAVQGNYRQSYAYFVEYKNLSDSIMDVDRAQQVARLQTLYELDKMEQENAGLLLENVKSKRSLETRTIALVIILLLVVVLGILLFILSKLNNRLLDMNKALSAQGRELEELNGQKDRFFSFVAHNLKNPFNTIMGFAELMQRANIGRDPEKARQYAGLIYDLSSQVQRVLSNLLEWSRLQRRTFECRPEPLEICSLIKDVLEMNTREAARKDIHFNLSASGSVYVSADRSMITTVLQNLVSNAINYTPASGQISIECNVSGQQTEISVTDTGVGISEESLKQLFTFDFSQKIGTSENNGAGLGLIICHEMIQKNNGTLAAESTPGKGSRFSFILPLLKQDETEQSAEPLSHLESEPPDDLLAGGRIVPPEALPEILAGLAPLYNEVSKVLSIENLETFSRSVTDTGEKYSISGLTGYGRTLTRLTRSHQIDQIIKILPRFRKYLDSLTPGN